MIKKTLKIFFAMVFLILKKIFIKENRVPHKIMDELSNRLHSIFVYSSFGILYISLADIKINSFDLNTALYIALFLQMVMITRYFGPKMLVVKETQSKIVKTINKVSLLIFILNWVFVSFGFAMAFIGILLLNNGIYLFIIKQLERQKEQEEFKKQFGEGEYSKKDIVKTHIKNLFESEIDEKTLTKSDIKKQYRNMAKKYHPDVYKGDEQDKFASINLSYNFLIDFVK